MGFSGAFPLLAGICLTAGLLLLEFLQRYAPTEELVCFAESGLLLCLTGTALPFFEAVAADESSLPLDGMR